jgi:outer membrane murein-binding lipoprotein Lpp
MGATMRRMVLASVVLATLLVGGCASKSSGAGAGASPGGASTQPSPPVQAKNDCTDFAASVKSGHTDAAPPADGGLPAGAHPVSLLKCVEDNQDVPGQGQWLVVNTVRSTGSVDGFVSALRAGYSKPAQPTPKGPIACAAVGYTVEWIVLVDADGTAYQIQIPFWGVCPAPDPDVLKALAAVPTTVASTERIRQTTSPGAQSSGCTQQFAEMAFVDAQANGSTTTRPFFAAPNADKAFRACFYHLANDADKSKPAGDYEFSATITGSQGAAIYNGLASAPVATATSCAAPATEYAVLSTTAGSGWSVVELDGCKLAAPDSGVDRQAPAPVVQALLAAKGG